MKIAVRTFLILGSAAALSGYLLYGSHDLFSYGKPLWKYKEKEIHSRLLAIPILLYHNIDGAGPFSIDKEVLYNHFQLFCDRNLRVISLGELIDRLENPRPFKKKTVVVTFDDGFYSMYDKLLPLIKEFHYPITLFVYIDFIYIQAKKALTWDKLKEMERYGIDIQCHTVTHPDLTELTVNCSMENRAILYQEIYLSKRIIELYMEKDVEFFAFPYGRYNQTLLELCRLAGYKRVFSTDYGSNIISRDNYSLRRQHIKRSYSLRLLDRLVR